MKEKIILSKKQKIILLLILKAGEMTKDQAKQIIKPFELNLNIDEAKEFLKKIENEI